MKLVCAHCMAEAKQAAMMDNPDPPELVPAPRPEQALCFFAGQTYCWRHLPVQPPMTEMEQQRQDEIGELFHKFFGFPR